MNNDLINREALKKVLCEEYEAREYYIGEKMLEAIDNAPTVDLWQMRQEATENALKKAEVLYGRPQGDISPMEIVAGKCPIEAGGDCPLRQKGEWIIESQETSFYKIESFKCSGCGWKVTEKLRFCPDCGARMNYQS